MTGFTIDFNESDITLNFDIEFDNFQHFYFNTKDEIFSKIIELFRIIKEKETHEATLTVSAKIDKHHFSTELRYDLNNLGLLNDVILPYFEEREQYEVCSSVSELIKNFKPLLNT
jgi:hypothetical protein